MDTLDDPGLYARIDSGGMHELIATLPEQAREAWAAGQAWEIPNSLGTPGRVVVVGMGGSAIGADVVAALAARSSAVPVHVWRGYDPPVMDDRTLVVACSFSGDTEETLSAFRGTLDRPGMRLAITTGGRLTKLAEEGGHPLFRYGWDGPPRTAFGYGLLPLLAILGRLGVLPVEPGAVETAIDGLAEAARDWAPTAPEQQNAAKQLARRLAGRMPVIIGADFLDVAAVRWARQVNENAKQWAFADALPEADHNLVVGFGSPAELLERLHVVLLDAVPAHERNRLRVRLTAQQLAAAGVPHEIVLVGGETMLDSLLRACYLGDWTSFYLAMLNETDPVATQAIDELKAQLAGHD